MRKFLAVIILSFVFAAQAFASSGNLPGYGFFPSKFDISFMGFTTTKYDGNQGGYEATDALCAAEYALSHTCQVMEILWMIEQKKALPDENEGWVNDGPPGYTANANDCIGWTSNAAGSYGRYWDFANKQGWMRGCNVTGDFKLPFACCK